MTLQFSLNFYGYDEYINITFFCCCYLKKSLDGGTRAALQIEFCEKIIYFLMIISTHQLVDSLESVK